MRHRTPRHLLAPMPSPSARMTPAAPISRSTRVMPTFRAALPPGSLAALAALAALLTACASNTPNVQPDADKSHSPDGAASNSSSNPDSNLGSNPGANPSASPSGSSTCDDDHPCPADLICKRLNGAPQSSCVKACGPGRDAPGVGENFPSADGCNSCFCTDNGPACTRKICKCDPSKEQNRRYNIKDPNQCKAALFTCPTGAKPFFNECGCGCEQSAECPPTINCMPGPGSRPCDLEAIKKTCPLSTVAN